MPTARHFALPSLQRIHRARTEAELRALWRESYSPTAGALRLAREAQTDPLTDALVRDLAGVPADARGWTAAGRPSGGRPRAAEWPVLKALHARQTLTPAQREIVAAVALRRGWTDDPALIGAGYAGAFIAFVRAGGVPRHGATWCSLWQRTASPDPVVRRYARRLLLQTRHLTADDLLEAIWWDEDEDDLWHIWDSIVVHDSCTDAVLTQLARRTVQFRLTDSHPLAYVAGLEGVLRRLPDVRHALVRTIAAGYPGPAGMLCAFGNADEVPLVFRAILARDPAWAGDILLELVDDRADELSALGLGIPDVAPLLSAEDPEVRHAALRCLGVLPDEAPPMPPLPMLPPPDMPVGRDAVAWRLAQPAHRER